MPRPRYTLDPAWTRTETWAFAEWCLEHCPSYYHPSVLVLGIRKVSTTGEEADKGFVGVKGVG